MFLKHPRLVLAAFILFTLIGSLLAIKRVKFSFDLEDFFPDGDADLAYFNQFRQKFEPDDNFLLVAVERKEGVFDSLFLSQLLDFSIQVKNISFETELNPKMVADSLQKDSNVLVQRGEKWVLKPIINSQSLLQVEYPIKTPFSFATIPAIHLEEPAKFESDKRKILSDERFVNTLINKDATTLVVATKTINNIQQPDAEKLIIQLHELLKKYPLLSNYHLLGRANFQKEMVEYQKWEFLQAASISALLVLLTMYLIFRRTWGVIVSVGSILAGLGVFVAMLGVLGTRLDTMALLYPIVMIIVATSDVIHVMSKYTDELHKGREKMEAIRITLREIGMSVFLTSATTAIGFISLLTSKIPPIRAFGFNAALGVMLAYLTVVTFTVSILTLFNKEQITKQATAEQPLWSKLMGWIDRITNLYKGRVLIVIATIIIICSWGVSKITTNNQILGLLPRGAAITNDFAFFEQQFSGFRPLEIAVTVKPPYNVDSPIVVQSIDRLEKQLKTYPKHIQSISSVTILYKTLHRAFNNDNKDFYTLPDSLEDFYKYQRLAKKFDKQGNINVLVSKDNQFARVSARILDVGADSVKLITQSIDKWIAANVDTTIMTMRQTGTGIIVDKNSEYVRDSLLWGLLLAVGLIAVIMVFLYKNLKMVIVALLPNAIPLLFAGALLGFCNIPLEGGVAIVFSIIFGIAVDDTIHFLGRYRLLKLEGKTTDEAVTVTLQETGKAMALTTIILFCGFVSLMFSVNPAANTVGLLISSTLFTALLCDLFLLPVLLRLFIK